MKRILFVEDDGSLIKGLTFAMEKEGYQVEVARTVAEGEALWREGQWDLVILDVALPDGSGLELCRRIRGVSRVPILFLTAADEETDIIMGLDLGGDDYMTKPFKLAVFLSRLRALFRRSEACSQSDQELCSHGIRVDRLRGEVYKGEEHLALTASEYRLLCLFMEHPGQILSPEQILSALWDCEEKYVDTGSLTVYIRRLRTKIEDDPGQPERIVTVRRMGYKWQERK